MRITGPAVVVDVTDETFVLRSTDFAAIVSAPPATLVLVGITSTTAPFVAVSEIGPEVVTMLRLPFTANVMPPLLALTVTELPAAPVLTTSMICTLGAVIMMLPLTVVAPAMTSGFAPEVIGRLPGAVRLGPSTV